MIEAELTPVELEVRGLTLRGWATGPEDGPRLLGLHGWLDNANTHVPLLPWLEGFRFVSLDAPGHGLSDHRPAGHGYHFIDYVVDASAAADALGWETFSVLGHSMGAGIGAVLAGAMPERVARLALLEGLGPMSNTPDEAPGVARAAIRRWPEFADRTPRIYEDLDTAIDRFSKARHGLSREAASLLVDRGHVEVVGGVSFRHDPVLRAPSVLRFTEEQVLSYLGAITAPVFLMRARHGWPVDPDKMRRRTEALAQLEAHEVDGHHHIHMDHPEHFGDALRSFLMG